MNLPLQQLKLIERVCDNHPNVIIILQGGAPTLMPYKDQVKAIINAYLPGEAGGKALYQILYGLHNPSGKLAESYPSKLDDTPSLSIFFLVGQNPFIMQNLSMSGIATTIKKV